MLNCTEALARLEEYVDGELSSVDHAAVREHLDACRPCLTHFEFEALFSEFVRRTASRPVTPGTFRERLATCLRTEEERLTDSLEPVRARVRRFTLAGAVVLAVAVAILIGLGSGRPGADWQTLVALHAGTSDLAPVESVVDQDPAAIRAVISRFLGTAAGGFIPDGLPSGLVFRAAQVFPWRSGYLVHLRLADSEGDFSLFMVRSPSIDWSTAPTLTHGGRLYRIAAINGSNAVAWETVQRPACIMVSSLDLPHLLVRAEAVRDKVDPRPS